MPTTPSGPVLPSDPSISGRFERLLDERPVYFERQGSRQDILRFPVYGTSGEVLRYLDLPGDIFNERIRLDVMHRYFVWQMARRRQGTHKTKARGEVRGGGRKPWPQKGTGRAPAGSIRAPQFRGGGHVKNKVPRDHSIHMNVKERRLGLKSALSAKARARRGSWATTRSASAAPPHSAGVRGPAVCVRQPGGGGGPDQGDGRPL